MEVTDIKIRHATDAGQLVANATVTIDGVLVIKDFRIVRPEGGEIFVAWPSRKRDDTYYDVVYSIDREVGRAIKRKILKAYNQEKRRSDGDQDEAREEGCGEEGGADGE